MTDQRDLGVFDDSLPTDFELDTSVTDDIGLDASLSPLDQGVTSSTAWLTINEVCPAPIEGEDWFELLVSGEGALNLSDYAVVDGRENRAPTPLPDLDVNAGDYITVMAIDHAPRPDEISVPFKLGKRDSLTVLSLADQQIIDQVRWRSGDAPRQTSWGRHSNDEHRLSRLRPTPGSPNQIFESDTLMGHPFTDRRVIRVTLELPEEAWTSIQDDPTAKEYYTGALIFDEVRIEQVSIRTKGNSSLKTPSDHGSLRYPFKIDLNAIVKGQTLLGVKKLSLSNGFQDPSH